MDDLVSVFKRPQTHVDDYTTLTSRVEAALHVQQIQRVVFVPYRDGMHLAWSCARASRRYPRGRWRLVVRDGDAIEDLQALGHEERLDIWTSGTMRRLVEEAVPEIRQRL